MLTPSLWFNLLRNSVALCLLYLGWVGILVFLIPAVVYWKLRRVAPIWQAFFLSFVSIWVVSYLVLLVSN